MAEPTLIQVFGAGATQTATTITISKADLAGLTPSATNTAESLFVAILLKAKSFLSDTNQETNIDQSVSVTDGFNPTFVTRNSARYKRDSLTIEMDKLDEDTGIDPDDY
jgi:hypothetical protein